MAQGRRGRRPGSPDTRGQIQDAASSEFARLGYDGATIRGIARAAAVDPGLVLHYFGSKEQLFIATQQVPVNPAAIVRDVLRDAGPGTTGEPLVAALLAGWDEPSNREPLIAVLRSVAAEGAVGDMIRQFVEGVIVTSFTEALPGPEAPLRAVLIGSQIVGLLMARYVVRVEPLASTDARRLATIYGPAIERYAYDPLPAGG